MTPPANMGPTSTTKCGTGNGKEERITVDHENKKRTLQKKMTIDDDDDDAVCHSRDADERSLPLAQSVLSKANKIMTKMQ